MRKPLLFLVTGASGTGKSTIVPLLRKELNNQYKIYDFDKIWKPYDFTKTWDKEVIKRALKIAAKNAQKGISTVVVGLIRPQLVKELATKETLPIKFCLLKINIKEREKRLKERRASKELIEDTEELFKLEKWLKETRYKYTKLNVTHSSPKEIANFLIRWIKRESM